MNNLSDDALRLLVGMIDTVGEELEEDEHALGLIQEILLGLAKDCDGGQLLRIMEESKAL